MNKSIIKYFKPYTPYLLIAFLLVAIGASAELMIPMMTKRAIDNGIAQSNIKIIIISGLLIISFALLRGLFTNLANLVFTDISTKVTKDLRQFLFNHVLTLSFAEVDSLQTGKLMTRIYNDTMQMRRLLSFGFRMLFQGILMIIGSLIMIFKINNQIGFIILVLALINSILFTLFATKAKKLFLAIQRQLDKLNSTIQQNLAGISVVKSFVAEDREIEIFNSEVTDLMDKRIQVGKLLSAAFPLLVFIVNFGVLIILWRGGADVIEGSAKIGSLIALVNYIFMIMFPLMMLGMVMTMFAQAGASIKRIKEIFSIRSSFNPTGSGAKVVDGNIILNNIHFAYPDRTRVLCGLSLNVRAGEFIGIIGSTGSGKSTLLSLIAGFYRQTEGDLRIDGNTIEEIGLKELRDKLSIVFQNPILFKMSLRNNISYGNSHCSDEEINKVVKISLVDNFIKKLPGGLNSEITERGMNLSGGQRQRVAIARALINNKPILILDDAFSSLDRITESRVIDNILQYRKRKTTLIISQKISSLKRADRIAILEDGKISDIDSHHNLLKNNSTYRDIYISQGYEL